ncbi:GrpB family protein [Sporomusa termitida]|uniref:GrpB protein n=1 Tax=Sporomusa termitida TaxID=2377 RepID=A0A517DQD0_9FIRM|nr:GrpB family protein [Sporomusa termitida]QDR79561.1 GrpB protein [Sporomusa termitida]
MKEMSLEELWQLYPIILKDHNPNYQSWYAEEKQRLLHSLHDYDICRINHIGSTSVAGLIAKPTIDILLELPKDYAVNEIAQLLQNDDWILMQKNDKQRTLDLGKGYMPTGFAEKVYHLHVKPLGDWKELYFRDYLRQYPNVARQYEALKLGLKERFEHDRDAYTYGKSDFVMEQSQKAKLEFAGRYLPPEH